MPSFQRFIALSTLAFISTALVGCGNGLARVSGKVTIDGQSINSDASGGSQAARATIKFYPKGGNGATSTAVIDEDGYYSMRTGSQTGIAPGEYFVAVSALQIIPADDPNYPPTAKTISPRKYSNPKTSGLLADVAAGSNDLDFDLVPDPEPTRRKRR